MPLYEKSRIELYIPDSPKPSYGELLARLESEFTYSFGGATVYHGLDGLFLARQGLIVHDRINLLQTDTPIAFSRNMKSLALYADKLRRVAMDALEEEAVLVTVSPIFHAEDENTAPKLTLIS